MDGATVELALDLNTVIGLAAMPFIIPLLVSDLRGFCEGIPLGPVGTGSPWPLVRDVLAVGWSFGLWSSGLLPWDVTWPAVVLLGLAVGVSIGAGRDFLVRRST